MCREKEFATKKVCIKKFKKKEGLPKTKKMKNNIRFAKKMLQNQKEKNVAKKKRLPP